MLVLTRKVGESIRIADSVTVTVLRTGRGLVRLGVEAPPQVRVLREELRRRLRNDHTTPTQPGAGPAGR
jgi:carbon storage regulator